MGSTGWKDATASALKAVMSQAAFPERYRRAQDCWEAHGASSSHFRTWRVRVRAFVAAAREEDAVAALVELSQRAPTAPPPPSPPTSPASGATVRVPVVPLAAALSTDVCGQDLNCLVRSPGVARKQRLNILNVVGD